MALRQIRIWPDPALKEVAKPVERVDDEVRQLISDLFETMYEENGVGLAATQVAVPLRVLVIDLDPRGEAPPESGNRLELESWGFAGPVALINPEIVSAEGSITWDEGCLSLPGISEPVRRKEHVVARALDREGSPFEIEARGLFSVCIQHEMDHLEGRVLVDHLSRLKRDVIKRKMVRLKSQREEDETDASLALP